MSRDVVVIGGGHNGLVAATRLASAGRKVTLVERRSVLGGLAAGEEFHPGYRSAGLLQDTSLVASEVVEGLGLTGHGLKVRKQTPSVWLPRREGGGIHLEPGAPDGASGVDRKAWLGWTMLLERARKVLRPLMVEAPPDLDQPTFGHVASLLSAAVRLRTLGADSMMDLLRVFPMCAADLVAEHFDDPLLQAGLCGPAIYGTYAGPWSPGTAANLLLGEVAGGPGVVGGPASLVASLTKAAEAAGVEVRTGAAVRRLRVGAAGVEGVELAPSEEGAEPEVLEARQVVASCDPRTTLHGLLDPIDLGEALDHNVRAFRMRGTTACVHYALSGPPPLRDGPSSTPLAIRTGEHVDELEKAFDAVKYGEFSETPALEVWIPTVEDPSLAPEGHHVATVLVHFAARDRRGGWGDDARDALAARVDATLEEFLPGFGDQVEGREVLTPLDIETRYGVVGGHLHHGEQALDQWVMRPTPECARYATPIAGLFLAGGGCHPGGGVRGLPGWLGAAAALAAS